jgi:glycosyltransferase involved in cell wall biosynthesis
MTIHPPRIALNAHLLSSDASYRSAGIHGYLYNTLAHLPEAAPDLALTVLVGSGQPPLNAAYHIQRSRWPSHNALSRIIWEQALAPGVLARLRPDLLHGMAFATPLLWTGPSVVTIFDLSFLRYPDRLPASRRVYLRTVTRVAAQRARRIIAISESGRSEIAELLNMPREIIDVAYPGVSPDLYPRSPEEIRRFRDQYSLPERFILYLGTLEPRKNLETLIRAYARLPRREGVRLVLAGGRGWRASSLLALVETLGLSGEVIAPGYIPGSLLPMWYNAAEIFAYPSVYEGFGMPLAEALACGVPVMASGSSSLPEAAGPGGVLLPADDVDAWAGELADLLADPARRRELAELGRGYVQRFSWQETARQTAEAYRRALSEARLAR